jgi:hypothetical protein
MLAQDMVAVEYRLTLGKAAVEMGDKLVEEVELEDKLALGMVAVELEHTLVLDTVVDKLGKILAEEHLELGKENKLREILKK